MSNTNKTTIYLDVEDDVTSIIEKVKAADSNIVALVPPKRMPTLQSSVNLKLLKKASKDSKKRVVIISSETTLLPLAGSVGVYVADTLKTRPYIPEAPESDKKKEIILDDESDASEVPHAPVGILQKTSDKDEEEPDGEDDKSDDKDDKKSKKEDKKSHVSDKTKKSLLSMRVKIPDFSKFRVRLILGGVLLVFLIVAWYFAFVVMPKAEIVINAQTTRVRAVFDFTLDEDASADDVEKSVLVPVSETLKKSFSQTVTATGNKNVGTKAAGKIRVRNCEWATGLEIKAGTVFTSESGFKFNVTSDAFISGPDLSKPASWCDVQNDDVNAGYWGFGDVSVSASEPGETYNLPNSTRYTHPSVFGKMLAIGSQMTNGTDEIITVVDQQDIDDAAESLKQTVHDEALSEIETQFATDITPIPTTFEFSESKPKGEPSVGEEADEVVVTLSYNYTILGVKTDSLSALIDKAIEEEVGRTELNVYDNGVDEASFTVKKSTVNVITDGFIGPELDVEEIKQEITGQRFSAALDILENKESVNSAEIELSPFWVYSVPKVDRIEIEVKVADHALQNPIDEQNAVDE